SWTAPKIHKGGEYKRYRNTEDGISPMLFPPSKEIIKWNSYEHDELGITTENADLIAMMHDKRHKKNNAIINYLKSKKTVNVFGSDGPLIFTYGSTTMSVLESLKFSNIQARVIQPIFLKPFPIWALIEYKNESVITVELSKAGQFSALLKEKAGINTRKLINRYDGRPFDPLELSKKIKEVL
ncbi:MAG: 2-oxoacid:acceptor oxidoreductase subunit alpha, partial [Promethearchaeota archaeon]